VSTLVVYGDTSDGSINSVDGYLDYDGWNGDYALARAGTGSSIYADATGAGVAAGQQAAMGDFTEYHVWEGFLSFDTSAITSGDTVSAATLRLTSAGSLLNTHFTLNARSYDWGTSVTTADFVPGANLTNYTLRAHHNTSSGWTTNTGYDLIDDAMAAGVVKAGSTRLVMCSSRTEDNNAPPGSEYISIKSADTTGTTSDPKLTITYDAGFVWDGPGPTLDAVIFRTQAGSLTADAVVMPTFSMDAVIGAPVGVVEESLSADADIYRSQLGSLAASAIVLRSQAGTIAADAVIFATRSATMTADAVIVRTMAASLAADAVAFRAQAGSATANAISSRTQAGSLTADAVVFRAQAGSATADAVTFATVTGAGTADAVRYRLGIGAATGDAVLWKTLESSLSADADIQKTFTGTFTADAVVRREQSATRTADADVLRTQASSFTADAARNSVARCVWTTPGDTVQITSTEALHFLMPVAAAGEMHFEIQLDKVATFDGGDLAVVRSHADQTGWEYWDGGQWLAVPQDGVSNAYCGNEARYTIQTPLTNGTWYRRVRAGVI
jgi:hypothetical protein